MGRRMDASPGKQLADCHIPYTTPSANIFYRTTSLWAQAARKAPDGALSAIGIQEYASNKVYINLVLFHESFLADVAQRTGQHAVRRRLSAERFADDHEAVPHYHHLVDLLDLLEEGGGALEVHRRALVPYRRVQNVVVGLRQLDAREQVAGDAVEQREVVRQELISYTPHTHTHTHTHNRFTALWILSGTTRVNRYQKKHSPTRTYRGHQSSPICSIHLLRSMASSMSNPHA